MDSLLPEHRGRTVAARPRRRKRGRAGVPGYGVVPGAEETRGARLTENDRTARAPCGRTERQLPCLGMYPPPRPVANQFRALSGAVMLGALPLQELDRAA